MKISNLLVRSR